MSNSFLLLYSPKPRSQASIFFKNTYKFVYCDTITSEFSKAKKTFLCFVLLLYFLLFTCLTLSPEVSKPCGDTLKEFNQPC